MDCTDVIEVHNGGEDNGGRQRKPPGRNDNSEQFSKLVRDRYSKRCNSDIPINKDSEGIWLVG